MDAYYRGGGIVPATGPNGGQRAVHQIEVGPDATSGGTTGVNERFHIFVTGDSGPGRVVPDAVTFAGPFEYTSNDFDIMIGTVTFAEDTVLGEMTATYTIDANTAQTVDSTLSVDIADSEIFTRSADAGSTAVGTHTITVDFEPNITDAGIYIVAGTYDVRMRIIISARAERTPFTISDITVSFTGALFSPRINLTSSRDSISESISITPGLNTTLALRDDFFNTVSTITNITNHWTVSSSTAEVDIPNYVDTGLEAVSIYALTTGTDAIDFEGIQRDNPELIRGEAYVCGGWRFRLNSWFSYNSFTNITTFSLERTSAQFPLRTGIDPWPPRLRRPLFREEGRNISNQPVVEFTSLDTLTHTLDFRTVEVDSDLSQSQLVRDTQGGSASATMFIDFQGDITGDFIDLDIQDRQGITNAIVESLNASTVYTDQFITTADNNTVTITDLLARDRELPIILVPNPGSTGLRSTDFTVTEIQPGIPAERTRAIRSRFTTDNTLAANEFGFYTDATGNVNRGLASWPTDNRIFLRLHSDEFILTNLQTIFDLERLPDETEQTINFSTVIVNQTFFNTARATYDIVGIQTVSADNLNINLILDGNTIADEVRTPVDGREGSITISRVSLGPINADIPDHPGSGNPLPPISLDNFYNANNGSTD